MKEDIWERWGFHLALKANIACIYKTHKTTVNWERVLKEYAHADLPAPGTNVDAPTEKQPDFL